MNPNYEAPSPGLNFSGVRKATEKKPLAVAGTMCQLSLTLTVSGTAIAEFANAYRTLLDVAYQLALNDGSLDLADDMFGALNIISETVDVDLE